MPRGVIEGFGGFELELVLTGDETNGELLERFEVLGGSMRTIIDGEERTYGVGEPFEVPAGTPHQMAAEEPTRMKWEVRPALRTAEFFERLYGDGPDSARELGEDFFAEFDAEFRLA